MRRLKRVRRVAAGDGASARVRPDQVVPELRLALARDDVLHDALAGVDIVEGVRYWRVLAIIGGRGQLRAVP